jgi:DNA processing protein
VCYNRAVVFDPGLNALLAHAFGGVLIVQAPPLPGVETPPIPSTISAKAYLLALSQVSGLGPRTLRSLLSAFEGSPQAVWTASSSQLKPHLSAKILEGVIRAQQSVNPQNLLETYTHLGIEVLDEKDPQYPPLLRQIYDPPMILFVRGNVSALSGKNLAFVGTRRISDYGRKVTHHLVKDLAHSGVCVVSGLAQGVDGVAHQAAIQQGLQTVAVFGCGIDVIYPKTHQALAQQILAHGGALVSEYPLGTQPTTYTFPQRNRIVAGLSYGVVVVEGNLKSGSLITARLALEENRQVYAVPGNMFSPGSEGPHHLIKSGAVPITTGQEILSDLHWVSGPPLASEPANPAESAGNLGALEREILTHIGYDPTPLDRVQQRSGVAASKLLEVLTLLELEGRVSMLAGAQVCRH